ncbi:MAG: ribonuclease PH [Trueperaceae bacterium]|nr:ribonuclease PH [Trueperaceae bacterium]
MNASGNTASATSGRANGRAANELRPLELTPGFLKHAEGSALLRWGNTVVVAAVTLEAKLPTHLRAAGAKTGWLTAEYSLLPRSTAERTPRERHYASGRTHEIQRLIGRALRSTVDLVQFRGKTITVDIDVIDADGGTRCAGIVAGYAALHQLAERQVYSGQLDEWPLRHEIGAVSVGRVRKSTLLDLDFEEDSRAEADVNVVATASGEIVEVQGAGEGEPIDATQYVELVATGVEGVKRVLDVIRPQLAKGGAR